LFACPLCILPTDDRETTERQPRDARFKRLVGASSLQKAVAVLLDEGIIDRNEATYTFCDPFYKQYIYNYASQRNASERN
jgi:hypothetical protein